MITEDTVTKATNAKCNLCGFHVVDIVAHTKQHMAERPYECYECQRCFKTKHNLKAHMETHINKRAHKCSLCPLAFNFNSELRKHFRVHIAHYPYQCEVCGAGFKYSNTLKMHARIHTGEKPFKCYQCDRAYTTSMSLKLHLRIHNGEKPYKCAVCDRAFADGSTLKIHQRLHTGENPFICHLCGKTTKQASNLKSHYKHYHKINDITCKTIRENARIFGKYKSGIKDETNQDQAKTGHLNSDENKTIDEYVDECNTIEDYVNKSVAKSENSFVNGDDSKVDVIPFQSTIFKEEFNDAAAVVLCETYLEQCPLKSGDKDGICEPSSMDNCLHDGADGQVNAMSTGKNPKSLNKTRKLKEPKKKKTRIKQEHKCPDQRKIEQVFIDENDERFHINEIEFECERFENKIKIETDDGSNCGLKQKAKNSLTTSTEISDDDKRLPSTNKGGKYQSCLICKKKYVNHDEHMRIHSHEKPFECDICHKSFKLKDYLRLHKKLHTERTIVCDQCGAKFFFPYDLKKHMRSHSDNRPHTCTICDKGFKSTLALKVHLRTHSGERPYKCTVCEKGFAAKWILRHHIRTHTGEKPYQCEYCDSRFRDLSCYRQHVRTHTGERPYKCHLCGKGTAQAGNLKSHFKHFHKIVVKHVKMEPASL